jgi:hypothetical protein
MALWATPRGQLSRRYGLYEETHLRRATNLAFGNGLTTTQANKGENVRRCWFPYPSV